MAINPLLKRYKDKEPLTLKAQAYIFLVVFISFLLVMCATILTIGRWSIIFLLLGGGGITVHIISVIEEHLG